MPKKLNLIGQRFNRLTVIEESPKRSKNGNVQWLCKCDCGNPKFIIVTGSHLKSGHTKSCGCLQKEKAANIMREQIQPLGVAAKENNLIGKKFGLLTVIDFVEQRKDKKFWKCQCDCGNITIVSGSDLVTQHTSSCGCLKNSKGELIIKEILNKNNIQFEQQKAFNSCKNKSKLFFDFFINNSYLIEYDGDIHFMTTGGWNTEQKLFQTQQHDKIKNQWCKDNNIPLIRIPYWHLQNLCIEDLLLETTKYRVV